MLPVLLALALTHAACLDISGEYRAPESCEGAYDKSSPYVPSKAGIRRPSTEQNPMVVRQQGCHTLEFDYDLTNGFGPHEESWSVADDGGDSNEVLSLEFDYDEVRTFRRTKLTRVLNEGGFERTTGSFSLNDQGDLVVSFYVYHRTILFGLREVLQENCVFERVD